MNIWESTITTYDKNINSILNEIAEEFSKCFEKRNNSICVFWQKNIFEKDFVSDQLEFSKEDKTAIKQKAKQYLGNITDERAENILEQYMESPLADFSKFYNFLDLEEKKNLSNTPWRITDLDEIYSPLVDFSKLESIGLFNFTNYHLSQFFLSENEEKYLLYQKEFDKVYKGKLSFDELFQTRKEEYNHLFFFNNAVWEKKALVKLMARRYLIRKVSDKYKSFNLSTDKIFSTYQKEFLSFPTTYIKVTDILSRGNTGYQSLEEGQLENLYKERKDKIIISAKEFLAFQYIIRGLIPDNEKRYHNFDYNYGFSENLVIEHKNEFLVSEMMNLILVKLEFIFANFDFLLIEFKDKLRDKIIFNTDEGIIDYLKRFYEDIEKSTKYKIQFLEGIALPISINNLILKCLQNIFAYKLDEKKKVISNVLLMPTELDEYDALLYRSKFVEKISEIENESRLLFSEAKIEWPEEKRDKLLYYFNQLTILNKANNKPYLSSEDKEYLLKANFSVFDGLLKPKPLIFNGNKEILRDFIYQLIKVMDRDFGKGSNRDRLTQFLIQNFKSHARPIIDEDYFRNTRKNIKACKVKKRPFVILHAEFA